MSTAASTLTASPAAITGCGRRRTNFDARIGASISWKLNAASAVAPMPDRAARCHGLRFRMGTASTMSGQCQRYVLYEMRPRYVTGLDDSNRPVGARGAISSATISVTDSVVAATPRQVGSTSNQLLAA